VAVYNTQLSYRVNIRQYVLGSKVTSSYLDIVFFPRIGVSWVVFGCVPRGSYYKLSSLYRERRGNLMGFCVTVTVTSVGADILSNVNERENTLTGMGKGEKLPKGDRTCSL
jgi:hypothetical protein